MFPRRSFRVWLLVAVAGGAVSFGQTPKAGHGVGLEKTRWKLIWMDGGTKIEAATPQQAPFMELEPDSHRVSGSGGCNMLMGTYELEGTHLKFTRMAMSRMRCLHGNETEADFSKALDQVSGWKMVRGKLLLMDADHHVVAKFVPGPAEQ